MKIVEKAKTVTIGGPKLKLPKKGYTKIELKNVYTGEKQVYEDENMMTNAIEKYFSDNGMLTYPTSDFINGSIVNRMLGGIALFDNTLEEDADNLFPYGALMTANGSLNVIISGNPTELGTYNPLKSGWIDGKFVQTYDWNQDHGNGTIACACLTSQLAGYIGFGNKSNTKVSNQNYRLDDSNMTWTPLSTFGPQDFIFNVDSHGLSHGINKSYYNNATHDDLTSRTRFTTIGKININSKSEVQQTKNIDIVGDVNLYMFKPYETTQFTLLANKKIYQVSHDSSPWTSSNKVRIRVVDEDVGTFYDIDPPEDLSNLYFRPDEVGCFIHNGYIYIPKCLNGTSTSNKTGDWYKIKISDGTLDSIIQLSTTWRDYGAQGYRQIIADGVYVHADRIINLVDDICLPINAYSGVQQVGYLNGRIDLLKDDNSMIRFLFFSDSYDTTSASIYYREYKNPFYLASINNLATPVTKTSDKTMTVSYTVTFD